jgi:hypothetical protein
MLAAAGDHNMFDGVVSLERAHRVMFCANHFRVARRQFQFQSPSLA